VSSPAQSPVHDSCRGPLILREEHPRGAEFDEDETLVCVLCGKGVAGTEEQIAQAEEARKAWEASER